MANYRIIDGADEIAWLLAGTNRNALMTGLQRPGFEARAVILHAMWEHPHGEGSDSFDSARRAAIAAGEMVPRIVGEVATGVPLGATARPPGWIRLLWSELAARWNVDLALDLSIDPLSCFRPRLTSGSWPVGIQPPPEGSLDWESFVRIVDHLKQSTGSQDVYNYSAPGAWFEMGSKLGSPPLAVGPLESMLDLYEDTGFGSGQNWWPADRSWLVYTDWDLSYSVIQGSAALVRDVFDDAEIEVVRLDPL